MPARESLTLPANVFAAHKSRSAHHARMKSSRVHAQARTERARPHGAGAAPLADPALQRHTSGPPRVLSKRAAGATQSGSSCLPIRPSSQPTSRPQAPHAGAARAPDTTGRLDTVEPPYRHPCRLCRRTVPGAEPPILDVAPLDRPCETPPEPSKCKMRARLRRLLAIRPADRPYEAAPAPIALSRARSRVE